MSRVIEICGSPGVGKSTIYKEVVKNWNKYDKWIPSEKLYPYKKIKLNNIKSSIRLITELLINRRNIADLDMMKEAGERFINQNPAYIKAFWKAIYLGNNPISNGKDLKFLSAEFTHIKIQRFQTIIESKSEKIAIMDEGLIHSIASWIYDANTENEELNKINQLLNLVPLPDALVYIDLDLEKNLERILNRKNLLDRHQSLSLSELKTATLVSRRIRSNAIKILKDKALPVLILNSTNSTKTNAKQIINFANELANGKG